MLSHTVIGAMTAVPMCTCSIMPPNETGPGLAAPAVLCRLGHSPDTGVMGTGLQCCKEGPVCLLAPCLRWD